MDDPKIASISLAVRNYQKLSIACTDGMKDHISAASTSRMLLSPIPLRQYTRQNWISSMNLAGLRAGGHFRNYLRQDKKLNFGIVIGAILVMLTGWKIR